MRCIPASVALALVLLSATSRADCPNACSSHGTCTTKDQCVCEPGYGGNDCSLRQCPQYPAWVDSPRGDLNHDGRLNYGVTTEDPAASAGAAPEVFPPLAAGVHDDAVTATSGEAHYYAECANRGNCNRDTGVCACFPGYTGAGCQRAACSKGCSGAGVCRTLREVAALELNKLQVSSAGGHKLMTGVQRAFDYSLWNADGGQLCICDAGYGGSDCSERACPRNDDPLSSGARHCGGAPCGFEVQSFTLADAPATVYRLGFVDGGNQTHHAFVALDVSAAPNGYVEPEDAAALQPAANTTAGAIRDALRALPFGGLARVEVAPAADAAAAPGAAAARTFRVTFVGVGGAQALLDVRAVAGAGGLAPNPDSPAYDPVLPTAAAAAVVRIAVGTYEEVECGGRGVCDRAAGVCTCAAGFAGEACQAQNSLAM